MQYQTQMYMATRSARLRTALLHKQCIEVNTAKSFQSFQVEFNKFNSGLLYLDMRFVVLVLTFACSAQGADPVATCPAGYADASVAAACLDNSTFSSSVCDQDGSTSYTVKLSFCSRLFFWSSIYKWPIGHPLGPVHTHARALTHTHLHTYTAASFLPCQLDGACLRS